MKLYQVEICPVRPNHRPGTTRFQMVQAEHDDLARARARAELCQPGEDICWVSEVLEEDREALLN